jgi:DNA-directed RNA polymerase specialized sigma24 family protein
MGTWANFATSFTERDGTPLPPDISFSRAIQRCFNTAKSWLRAESERDKHEFPSEQVDPADRRLGTVESRWAGAQVGSSPPAEQEALDNLCYNEELESLKAILSSYTPEERALVLTYLSTGKSIRQLAKEEGVSHTTVHRRKIEAQRLLRDAARREGLLDE